MHKETVTLKTYKRELGCRAACHDSVLWSRAPPWCGVGAQQGWLGFQLKPLPPKLTWSQCPPHITLGAFHSGSFSRSLNAGSGALVPSSGTGPSSDVWMLATEGPQPLAWPEEEGRQ